MMLDNYMRPRYLYGQYFEDVQGQWRPLLTKVGEGNLAEAEEYSSDMKIFGSYWFQ